MNANEMSSCVTKLHEYSFVSSFWLIDIIDNASIILAKFECLHILTNVPGKFLQDGYIARYGVHTGSRVSYVPFVSSQDTFTKAMLPLYEFVVVARQEAVDTISAMEKAMPNAKLSPYSFKVLEQFRDPADFHEVARQMLDDRHKATAVRFATEAQRILRARWWIWVLQHPGLTEEEVHPTKSMFPTHHALFVGCCVQEEHNVAILVDPG